MDKFIGFDIDHKHTLACVVQAGQPDRYRKLRTDVGQLREWLKMQRGPGDRLHLTFEVSGLSGHLYDGLVDIVDRLEVSNPTKLTWIYRTAKKNDRIDARKQAVLLSMNELPRVHMPREGVREWRRTIQHRRNVVNTMTQTKNRIRSLLKSQDLKKAHRGTWWNTTNRTWMRQQADRDDAPWRDVLADLLDTLELQQRQLQRVTRQLDARLDELPGAWLLMTIPGVGPRTVEAVLAYTDEIRRFRRGKQYGAYFGLTPRLDESGPRRFTGHISKQGPSVVRWLIVESAWRAVRHSPALRAFHERVMHGQRQRNKIAIVATARKLLTIMRAMLMTGETFSESLVSEQAVPTRRSGTCVA
jgi:transposase